MTSVAIWLNMETKDNPSLWAIADTRISSKLENGNSKRSLDIFPKLFEMPIKVSVDATQFRFSQVHSVGLAFAGSTLLASAAKDILSYLFGRLSLSHSYDFGTPIDIQKAIKFSISQVNEFNQDIRLKLPSLSEMKNILIDICEQLMESHVKNTQNTQNGFEFCIFGYCIKLAKFVSYVVTVKTFSADVIEQKIEEGIYADISVSEKIFNDEAQELDFVLLGDKKSEISDLIKSKISTSTGMNYWRSPASVISEIVDEQHYFTTIGSHAQLLMADTFFTKLSGTVTNQTNMNYFGYKLMKENERGEVMIPAFSDFYFTPATIHI